MKELKIIRDICFKQFNVDKNERSRETPNVLARFAYYYYALNHTKYTLKAIGKYVGYDHATVIHGSKRFEIMKHQYSEYKGIFNKIDFLIKEAFGTSLNVSGMTFEEMRITVLEKKLKSEQNKNGVLKKTIKRMTDEMPKEIYYILNKFSKKELQRFVNTRAIPSIILNKSQKERIEKHNPRAKQINNLNTNTL